MLPSNARLPAGSLGSQMTYKSPDDGKPSVVISAGGARPSDARGDTLMAYALPN